MRSKAQQDQWQETLLCPLLLLDGGASLEENTTAIGQALEKLEENKA